MVPDEELRVSRTPQPHLPLRQPQPPLQQPQQQQQQRQPAQQQSHFKPQVNVDSFFFTIFIVDLFTNEQKSQLYHLITF